MRLQTKLTCVLTVTAGVTACTRDARPPASPTIAKREQATAQASPSAQGERMSELTAFIDPGDSLKRPVLQAMTVLHASTGQPIGTVRFVEVGRDGLDMFATIDKLPAGTHAYHVHVYGDCSAPDFKSAGPHFHFTGSSLDTSVNMITGNLGELTPDSEGRVVHRARLPYARLQGPFSVLGRAVVIHEKGNDPAVTPDGGAGARIACGVIGIANPELGEPRPTASMR